MRSSLGSTTCHLAADDPGRFSQTDRDPRLFSVSAAADSGRNGMARQVGTKVKIKKQVETDLGFSWGMLNSIFLGVGIGALIIGYLALSKGSTTLAPVALVAGYCLFIPASLLIRGRGQRTGE
jgi:hypothetical protein